MGIRHTPGSSYLDDGVNWYVYYLAGQQLTFKGTSYANNTSLFITDLGDVDNNNVLCMTDLTDCCTGVGQWIYQDGFMNALVRNNRSGDDIFRTRGDMVVRLERRNNPIGPTGQYCCQVPTMANPNTDSTMCVILSEFHGQKACSVCPMYMCVHMTCCIVYMLLASERSERAQSLFMPH